MFLAAYTAATLRSHAHLCTGFFSCMKKHDSCYILEFLVALEPKSYYMEAIIPVFLYNSVTLEKLGRVTLGSRNVNNNVKRPEPFASLFFLS